MASWNELSVINVNGSSTSNCEYHGSNLNNGVHKTLTASKQSEFKVAKYSLIHFSGFI